MIINKEALDTYNREILDTYHIDKNAQNVVMPGFFNGEILFVGQNPGLLKESVEGDMEYLEAYKNRDLQKLSESYLKALKSTKGTLGTFLLDIFGDDWSKISFTNVFKTPFNDNDVEVTDLEPHLEVLKKQIELLKPKYIFAIGKIAEDAINKIGYQAQEAFLHPSYLKRIGQYEVKVKEYSKVLESLLFKYFITLCDVTKFKNVCLRYNWKGKSKTKTIENYPFFFYIEDADGFYESYDGKKASLMYFTEIPGRTYEDKQLFFKQNLGKIFESDVYKNIKYMIEEGCEYDRKQKAFYFDIETNLSFDTIKTPEPVITISGYDTDANKYSWAWRKDLPKHEIEKFGAIVKYFNDEKDMIKDFFTFLKDKGFDILTGWNSDTFDVPYLFNRAQLLGIDLSMASPFGYTSFRMGEDRESARFRIYGTNHVDLMRVYQKMTYDKRPPSYSLGSVGKHLGIGDKYAIGNITEAWQNRLDELIEYNIRDCELLYKIDEKAHLLDLLKTLQNISTCPIDLCIWNKNICDCYILKTYNGRFIFPDIDRRNERKAYEGAITGKIVFDADGSFHSVAPEAGMFDNVGVPDFSSMYPGIFQTFNVSAETIDENGDIEIDGVRFTSKKEGIIPALFNNLKKRRKEYEKIRDSYPRDSLDWYIYSNFQAMIKQIGNSLYGLNGYPYFRLFNPKVAKTITYIGRQVIAYSWKKAEELGYKPLYGDTDSLFIRFDENLTPEEVIAQAKKLEVSLNSSYKEFVLKFKKDDKHFFSVDTEKIFKRIIFTGVKKKYIGKLFYKKGERCDEIFGRGIELIKRDTPTAFKKFLKTIVEKLLNNEDDILDYINTFKRDLKKNYILQDIGIAKSISKHLDDYNKTVPQHIRAVRFSNANFGSNFMKADIPRLFYVTNPNAPVIALDYEATELPAGYEIDWDKYFENFIDKKLEMFYAVQNLSNQRQLSKWF
jgi:DNA polymerase elongation subunit (family B)